jgi:spore coat polysaccharide biosynthesis protein SpsF (cytidylyltransferase family)
MVIAIVQARLNSTRFPNKVLADINGKPMIVHVLERAKRIEGVDLVVAAIPYQDTRLEKVIREAGVFPVLGHEEDVLSRFVAATLGRNVDTIVRLTGDCPAFDPTVASKTLALFLANRSEIDYASNDTLTSGYPDGWDVEVFSLDALEQANAKAKKSEREHVTTWMKKHLTCMTLKADAPWAGPKLSVDTPEELAVVTEYLNGTLINVLADSPVKKRGKKA